MGKREFSKVSPAVWRSGRFQGLQCHAAQVLYLFLVTCEHQNSAGCFRLPDGYACADLSWPLDVYVAARDRLVDAGLITFDAATSEVFVDRWYKHNPPTNDKHAYGTRSIISAIESDVIREKAEEEFEAADDQRQARSGALKSSNGHLAHTGFMRGRT